MNETMRALRALPELLPPGDTWDVLEPLLVANSRINFASCSITMQIVETDTLAGVRTVLDLKARGNVRVQFYDRKGRPVRAMRFYGLSVQRADLDLNPDSAAKVIAHDVVLRFTHIGIE